MKILVLGASGMIGRAMLKVLNENTDWQVIGVVRAKELYGVAPNLVMSGIDLTNPDHLARLFFDANPNVVINCAGLTKHLPGGNDPISALSMNALLPHRLAGYCDLAGARLIHISTDCVFSGKVGGYTEADTADAVDVYGRTKALGEVASGNSLTLRTSTIGHEYGSRLGLLEWFLAQSKCQGYNRAIFSGLPTVEFARVVKDFVIPAENLSGIYHVGAAAIDKFTLLTLIKKIYKTNTIIENSQSFCIDRSLNSDMFTAVTGYRAPGWPELIESMRQYQSLEG